MDAGILALASSTSWRRVWLRVFQNSLDPGIPGLAGAWSGCGYCIPELPSASSVCGHCRTPWSLDWLRVFPNSLEPRVAARILELPGVSSGCGEGGGEAIEGIKTSAKGGEWTGRVGGALVLPLETP